MSDQLPILDELEAAASFAAIAEWLTRCPLAVFASHGHEIEAIVVRRRFSVGADYVQCYVSTLHECRDGTFKPHHMYSQDGGGELSSDLRRAAGKLDDALVLVAPILNSSMDWHKGVRNAHLSEAIHAG